MKKQWKGFTLGVVLTLLIVSMVGSAFAAYQRQETLEYADIKIVIDGDQITPTDASGNIVEPFIIDGTTYLPIRAIANALGLDVAWDNTTKTATLTTQNAVKSGTVLYDDENVTIAFSAITESDYDWAYQSEAQFIITNKTDYELTFQPGAISFDGVSYEMEGSEDVAPNSTGTISFRCENSIPQHITETTGTVSVIDFSREFLDRSYTARWTGSIEE